MTPNNTEQESSSADHPQTDKESRLRSVLKGVSWRIVGTVDTVIISWLVTGSVAFAATIGTTEVITKMVLYYMHERAWQMIPRGTVRKWRPFRQKA